MVTLRRCLRKMTYNTRDLWKYGTSYGFGQRSLKGSNDDLRLWERSRVFHYIIPNLPVARRPIFLLAYWLAGGR